MSAFDNATLMITGGTGSFGSTVLKHFLDSDLKEIRIFSRDEKKQDDMRHELQAKHPENAKKVKFYIGDVRNPQSIRDAMPGVDYIFHAAALKQVPSCEFFPMEAVRTNIVGTDNVLHAAIEAGVKRVVCLSTDKAAYPINAMGISKAMMEHVIYANARGMLLAHSVAACFRDPHNPLYNPSRAKTDGYRLFCQPGLCPFDLLKLGITAGLLPDAQFPFTNGQKTLQENADFLARYYLGEYYEAD